LLAIWFATANNAILGADTARRTLHIRFSSNLENPEERDGFKYPDLLKWVREERPRLVAAALTILRAFCAAGMPSQGLPRWGSFEAWSDLVRQSVAWVGLPDPGATRAKLADASDSEANLLRLLIAGWDEIDEDGEGMLVSDVLAKLSGDQSATKWKPLREALAMLPSAKAGSLPSAKSIGMKLHHLRGRVVGGVCFERRTTKSGTVWRVCGSA
jgi:putative DNA primase/helicase